MLPFLKRMIQDAPPDQLIAWLQYTAFDELFVIHLKDGTYETRYHSAGKFYAPALNDSFRQLVNYASAHMVHPEDREAHLALMDPDTLEQRLEAEGGILVGEIRYEGLNGNWHLMQHLLVSGEQFGLPAGEVHFYIFDIPEIRERVVGQREESRAASERVRNRMPELLTESAFLEMCAERIRQDTGSWCVIAVDIKYYKLFKDLNGRRKGEKLLVRCGEVLRQAAERLNGLACYRGQDEFGIYLPFDRGEIDRIYSDMFAEIDALSTINGFYPIFGICLTDDREADAIEMFNRAALTAEEIKDDLRHHIRLYNPELHERHVEEFRILSEYRKALKSGAITFCLQPQVHVATRRIVGAESLARWKLEEGTYISPARFIPVLEKYGVVTDLDIRIWEQVCAWLRDVQDRGIRPVPISVNVSRIDIASVDVPSILSGLIEKNHLTPDLLKVEITESAYAGDAARVQATISALREKGFQVLMDDFGSGYSSLNMLRSISVDVIKLDAQFLHFSPGEERRGINILESVINLTKSLGMPIIVEGVETRELIQFLWDMGCQYMQGYYYYRPMLAEQFENLLENPLLIDHQGIVARRNLQLHTREFLDENTYSDAMLNNILGPVAYYSRRGDNVDIVRYNQQFIELIDLDTETMEQRRMHIQQFFYPEDRKKFFDMLDHAAADRINGANGLFRVFKPNGAIFWMQLHVYLLRERGDEQVFYGSARDMTELQYVNQDLPGAYYRTSLKDGYEFRYISENLEKMIGFSREEILQRFENRMVRLIHPEDLARVDQESAEIIAGTRKVLSPYRLLHRSGKYLYVMDQCRVTDQYGELCWQSVLMDITEVMVLRNRMRLLEKYSTDCIVFIHDIRRMESAEIACYGLQEELGIDEKEFRRQLIQRTLLILDGDGKNIYDRVLENYDQAASLNGLYTLQLENGKRVGCHVRFNRILERDHDVECIVSFTIATGAV